MGGSLIRLIFAYTGLSLALATTTASPLWAASDCPKSVYAAAREVRDALYAEDVTALSELIHDGLGVRVSTAAYVIAEEEDLEGSDRVLDRVLDRNAVWALWSDPETYYWGDKEGSGKPIERTGAAFVSEYVTNQELHFETAEPIAHDPGKGRGTTFDNAADKYPEEGIVEFISGEPPENGAALRLAFAPEEGCQRLVGLILARW
ncbi:hypothetical protein [Parasedimentitalea psychrophila]|uniref:Uncharacterized protein n=1 Tax=Parasedimentitalea psychrophila TaxID=2997337 RepID=A0A9Y2KWN4_9RHOB|nr:hypothetical protein [Parasedimentitalea psychrophila]WIY24521.1 hypothetical protein QPJ95_18535 [Parasedimentitalea psychrophila]